GESSGFFAVITSPGSSGACSVTSGNSSVGASSCFTDLVTPALKRGLNPDGLLTAGCSASGCSEGVCATLLWSCVADLVTPALKRGLNPAGLLAAGCSASG